MFLYPRSLYIDNKIFNLLCYLGLQQGSSSTWKKHFCSRLSIEGDEITRKLWIRLYHLICMYVKGLVLQDKVADYTFEILTDYHTATVSLLALLSASTEDVSF